MKKKWDGAFTKIDSPNTLNTIVENNLREAHTDVYDYWEEPWELEKIPNYIYEQNGVYNKAEFVKDAWKAYYARKNKVKKATNNLNEEIENEQLDEIESFIEDIYALRKSSIAEEGEYSIGNLIFKECRNKGYLDNLKELKNKIIGDELSLGESLEDTLDQDLVDNRQPVDFSVLEYDEPFDHKSNLAHEKCLIEEEYITPYDWERKDIVDQLHMLGEYTNTDFESPELRKRFSNAVLYNMLKRCRAKAAGKKN